MGEVVSNIVGSAVNLVTGIYSSEKAHQSVEETNETNVELSNVQNQFNAEQAQLNREFQADEAEKTRQYNSYSAQVERAKEAGINPAVVAGGTPTAVVSSPAGSQATSAGLPHLTANLKSAEISEMMGENIGRIVSQIPQMKEALSRAKLAKADARKVQADAEYQEIINKREKTADSYFQQYATILNWTRDENGDFVCRPISNKGGFEAYKAVEELKKSIKQWNYEASYAEFQQRVVQLQKSDPHIASAFAHLTEQEYNNLQQSFREMGAHKRLLDAQVKKVGHEDELVVSQKELTDLQKKMQESESISQIINKLVDPDASWSDKGTALVTLMVMMFSKSVGINFNR